MGVALDQRLASGSGVPYSPSGEGALRKALDGPIDSRARKPSNTGDDRNASSSQLLGVERSDQMLLSLIQVRKQRVESMPKYFCLAHASSIARPASCVTINVLQDLSSSASTYASTGRCGSRNEIAELKRRGQDGPAHHCRRELDHSVVDREMGRSRPSQALMSLEVALVSVLNKP